MSQLGWVDFSSTDREQVTKILAMIREPGTLDELGIGQIRDAFADLLFPGFSTIQTRAKYLITVPRIFRDYHLLSVAEKKRNPLEKYLKECEDDVAQQLVKKHGIGKEKGIIGSTMIDKDGVSRRPSSVYWNAYRQFGIIKENLSLHEFCRAYEKVSPSTHHAVEQHDEGSDDDGHFRLKRSVELPDLNENWMSDLSLDLSKKEAQFLVDYITLSTDINDAVASQLLKYGLLDTALEDEYNSLETLTLLLINEDEVSSLCKDTIKLANEFSLAMEGPHIRYNIVLAQKNGFENSVEKYIQEFKVWREKVRQIDLFYQQSDDIWLSAAKRDHTRPFKPKTTNFIKAWSKLIREGASEEELDKLVEKQAIDNKKERSQLRKKVLKDEWVGIRRLDYRWFYVQKILKDIQKGLLNA
jgi:hypothetical protein